MTRTPYSPAALAAQQWGDNGQSPTSATPGHTVELHHACGCFYRHPWPEGSAVEFATVEGAQPCPKCRGHADA